MKETQVVLVRGRAQRKLPTPAKQGRRVPLFLDEYGFLHAVIEKDLSTQNDSLESDGPGLYTTWAGHFGASYNSPVDIILTVNSLGGVAITQGQISRSSCVIFDASENRAFTISMDQAIWNATARTIDLSRCDGYFLLAAADEVQMVIPGPIQYPEEKIIDLTDATATTRRYIVSMKTALGFDYDKAAIDLLLTGGVEVWLFASNNPNADASADDDWIDKTEEFTGGLSSLVSDELYSIVIRDCPYARLMIKVVTLDATNRILAYQTRSTNR